jgi:hypothetical protein
MAEEVFMDLPPERRDLLRKAMRRAVMNATRQVVRQFEHACNQMKIDPRFPPETFALVAATPAILGGVLFKLEDDPD